jgi:uncharacterized protein
MTPQEQQLITELFARLKQTPVQVKDAVADHLIRRGVTDNPEAPYRLVQTVLIQEMALSQAQHRVAELENRVVQANAASSAPPPPAATSFLGDPVSRGGMPPADPWGRAPQPTEPASPPTAPAAAPGTMSAAPSGFLRSAAATALGVVGGQMLFQGIESMFGQHAGSILSGQSIQPALSETVVNNFYGDQPSSAEPSSDDLDAQDAEKDPSVADDDLEQDDSFDDGDTDLS